MTLLTLPVIPSTVTAIALYGINPAINTVTKEIIAPVRQVPVRLTGLLQAWL
jgi:hypothetical protein